MKLKEDQLFDYIFCPCKYDIKHNMKIDVADVVSLPKLLSKVSKFFYFNLLNGKVCSISELKNKWDSVCKANMDFVDAKMNLAGYGLIVNLAQWAANERFNIMDMDTRFNILVDDVEVEGCMEPIMYSHSRGKLEFLITNFNNKVPDQVETDMKLKYTLDTFAYQEMYKKEIDGIRIHVVKSFQDLYSRRNDIDFARLKTTIKSVAKGIEQGIYYPRENNQCPNCTAREYCRFWHKK